MANLFENTTKKLVDKIEFLSTQIQHFYDVNSILNNINYVEKENEEKQTQLQNQETYFDRLYELFSRSNIIVNCENELNQFITALQKMTDNFFSDFKQKRDSIAVKMNEIVTKMKVNEKRLNEEKFTEEFEKQNFGEFVVQTETEKKQMNQQKIIEEEKKKEEEMEKRENENERKESEERELQRWKLIEEEEKKIHKNNYKRT